jgi:superfamily II DNA or RNA helicase
MTLANEDIERIESIRMPVLWGVRHNTRIAEIAWMVEPERETHGHSVSFPPNQARGRELMFTAEGGTETVISFGAPSNSASQRDRLVRSRNATVVGNTLDLSAHAQWGKHPEQLEYSVENLRQQRDIVLSSWSAGIIYRSDKNTGIGFRMPQIGALHAIAAHWSVSQKAGIIVMPTGTGKTEVMVATALAAQCRTVLVVVPSDALRSQTANKFQTLGVLRSIGVIPSEFLFPVVGTLRRVPKDEGDLDVFDCCNVVVATMSALSGATDSILDKIVAHCTHLFIDEAHHAPAETWNNLRERFSERSVLQFTATPFRRDGRRMEGRILYNYPLAKAQAEGYFQSIRFEQVWEWDEEAADEAIAKVALDRLREDLAKGFDHIVMARTDSIARAQSLYDTIYSAHPELHPVVVHNATPGRRKVLEDIKARKHRVIVCVDMLGEGFDLPQLKIAALHDAHRSLGVTLQFAGRFTRTSHGIGEATVVANLADRKVSGSLEELYSEDADWNRLLPGLSYDAIRPQLRLSEFVGGLQSSVPSGETEVLTAATIQPKTSTVIYEAERFRPDAFSIVLPRTSEVVVSWKNPAQSVLLFVLKSPEELGWARTKDVTHLIYDLYLVFYDAPKKLLFIHSSVKSTHLPLARAIGGKVAQMRGENMFRVLGGIERILFYNAGLLRSSGGAVRFQMFAGLDVAKAIDPVEQQGATKSNLFGAGYEEGRRVTIGCSQKGTVWSQQTSSVPDWMEWCRHIGAKLVDKRISTTAYLDHTLVPEAISTLPTDRPLCIEWPAFIFERITKGFDFSLSGRHVSWLDCDLDLSAWTAGDFEFVVAFPDGTGSTFRAALSSDRPLAVTEVPTTATYVKSAEMEQSLAQFFEEHPPLLRFQNGTELAGNILVKPRTIQTHQFPLESLVAHDWTGVDITRESKWKNGVERTDSVQHFVIRQLLTDSTFTVVMDDDDSGEAADVIGIRDTGDRVEVHLFHCKFSDATRAGSRADDLYVVCGQAEKGVMWTLDFNRLVDHIIHRENKTLNGRASRFERGCLKDLYRIQRASRKALPEYSMTVVQPGVSKTTFKPEHSSILGATSLFLRQRLNTALKVWVSA